MSVSDSVHPLNAFLQLQLASDSAAILNLPYLIRFLSPQHLQPSPHIQKWITRINSLIHSKDPGARWAGLSIACQTAIFSQQLMLENARGWVSAALPLFSVRVPTIARLINLIPFAVDIPEFQRQIASPNVPKFGLALILAAEDPPSRDFKLLAIDTLSTMVPLYPAHFKALHGRLSALCLRQINGLARRTMDGSLTQAISRLYSILPVTGGKVGTPGLWRKSVDEVLAIGWASLHAVKSTIHHDGLIGFLTPKLCTEKHPANIRPRQSQPQQEDLAVSVPLNVDRLRCAVLTLCDLLTSETAGAVQLPLGALVSFSQALLSCTRDDDKDDGSVEPSARAMEETIFPEICTFGSDLLSKLAACVNRHLTPHAERFTNILLFHLEQSPSPSQHVLLLRALLSLLTNVHTLNLPSVPNRITKVLLSTLSVLLQTRSEIKTSPMTTTYSLASRVLLSLYLSLPSMDPTRLSRNLTFQAQILRELQVASLDISASALGAMSRSLGLVIHGLLEPLDEPGAPTSTLRELDMLLHPRVPPLVRSLPHVESLSLSRAEESVEEREIRERLHIDVISSLNGTEVISTENRLSAPIPALASLPPLPNPSTLADVDVSKTPAPAPFPSSLYPQAAEPLDLQPTQYTSAQLQSRLGAAPEIINPAAEDDDGDDEEMPSIDMASDSD
ncbi:hypothetical protein B0F90DRAFT_1814005 [Multifurca ochricompacta]|uniref:Pre-rRNA-processing protein RIX1 n=1 Tax=Multifurca ochricompacta TaxID=376703 RepID=A0AAD4MB95_9AGAM|nr:hypothetical protein B0F90DRAFT_1814005 [Multifurca ochricompacta]